MLSRVSWADKNGMVSGRLACISSKIPEILNSKAFYVDCNHDLSIRSRMYFDPQSMKVKYKNP